MRIEFLEHDGMLQENGLPKIVVVSVDGVKFPYQSDKKIVDLYRDAQKIKTTAPAVLGGDGLQRPIESQPGDTMNKSKQLQRNDTVRFLGVLVDGVRQGSEDGDLVVGGLYKVMETEKDTVAIINPDSDFPIRLTVRKSDVELVEKGVRVTHVKRVFEQLHRCLCGKDMALEKQPEGNYMGVCQNCHHVNTSPAA